MDAERKKLLYKAQYRGFKEADLVLGLFVRKYIQTFLKEEVISLLELLELPDPVLYDWIIQKKPPKQVLEFTILEKIRAFNVSKYISKTST